MEGQTADTIRTRLQELKFQYNSKKSITEKEYQTQFMNQIAQLEVCAGTTLTEQELAQKHTIQT